jgi:hypothetical protein
MSALLARTAVANWVRVRAQKRRTSNVQLPHRDRRAIRLGELALVINFDVDRHDSSILRARTEVLDQQTHTFFGA